MLPVQFDLRFRKKKSKKKEELAFERVKLPESLLFPYDVVVDFFFHEEIQRRQRKEREKKGRNSPARVKTPRTRTPFVRSFAASFHSSAIFTFHRYKKKTLDLCISKRKSKRWRKELPPFHPLSSIDRSIDDSNVCDFLAHVGHARTKKWCFICARKCAQMRARESEDLWDV